MSSGAWTKLTCHFPAEVAAALAYVVGNKLEAARRRGDLFEKRRRLMEAWAVYCLNASDASRAVIPLMKR
jgi:hypothetical protein